MNDVYKEHRPAAEPSQATQQRAWEQAFILWTNAKGSSITSKTPTKPLISTASGRMMVPVVDAWEKVEPSESSIKVIETVRKNKKINTQERLLYDPYVASDFDPFSSSGGGYSDPTTSSEEFSGYTAPEDLPSDVSTDGSTSIGNPDVSTDPFGNVASQLYQDGTIAVEDVHAVTSVVVGVEHDITDGAGTLAGDAVYELGGDQEAQTLASGVGSAVADFALHKAADATGCVGCLDAVDLVNGVTGDDPTKAVVGEFSPHFISWPSLNYLSGSFLFYLTHLFSIAYLLSLIAIKITGLVKLKVRGQA